MRQPIDDSALWDILHRRDHPDGHRLEDLLIRSGPGDGSSPGDGSDTGPGPGSVSLRPDRPATADARQLAALFGPLVLHPPETALVLAHLGQSVDGRIATETGQSHYIGGAESLVHLHRLRALVDVVVIGAETACLDRPRLTVRRVPGRNPVRAVIDPRGRLPADCPLLTDGQASTLVLTARTADTPAPRRRSVCAEIVPIDPAPDGRFAPSAILAALAARGLTRVLVEGGGGTVSRFLAAGCLHRLQLAIAPLIIGSGRPALSLPAIADLTAALRPACRIWPLGPDVLFDFCFEPVFEAGQGSANKS